MYLSYLPISHSYEHTVGKFFLPSVGSEIVYSRGVEHLAADMLTIRPTILTAVPRVLEVIRSRVLTQVARQPAGSSRCSIARWPSVCNASMAAPSDWSSGCSTRCSIVSCARKFAPDSVVASRPRCPAVRGWNRRLAGFSWRSA